MAQLEIRGAVFLKGQEVPLAGVPVEAELVDSAIPGWPAALTSIPLVIGHAVSGEDGGFSIACDEADERLRLLICALECSGALTYRLTCRNSDGKVLHLSEPLSYGGTAEGAADGRGDRACPP